MISPFGPIGASCLIPPPNLLPIPAAIITNVALLICEGEDEEEALQEMIRVVENELI